jgi:hypothetical protein
MKSPQKSRFGKLVTYLLDPQGKKKTRVGEVVITNCVSTDTTWAVREIAATQWLNTRAKSPRTYHLIISLKDGANPNTHLAIEVSRRTEEQQIPLKVAQDAVLFAAEWMRMGQGTNQNRVERSVKANRWFQKCVFVN